MASGFGESRSMPSQSESPSANNNNNIDAGDFECNICFDLAQDPIVTLCGHLFCWPCLYRWLRHHSQSHECPVCKALVQEDKLVPLYGRGKTQSDPRYKSYPGIDIPNRPAGQRPETAPSPPQPNPFSNGFGFMGGFAPVATARIGNFSLSTAFGGLFPSLFNIQIHGFPSTTLYGTTSGFAHGVGHTFYGGNTNRFPQPTSEGRQADILKNLLFLIGFLVLLALIW